MADATDTTAADETEAPEVDEARQAVLATLTDALGDALLDSHVDLGVFVATPRPSSRRVSPAATPASRCSAGWPTSGATTSTT